MKNILCFGDSLTWGFKPEDFTRYPIEQRWTGILQKELGSKFHIIEEGLNGRNTIFEDPYLPGRNSENVLPIILESHAPLDLVIILLGTNDIKTYIKGDAKAAALGCSRLVRLVATSQTGPSYGSPEILLLAPPAIIEPKGFMGTVFEGSEAESLKFASYYQSVAEFNKIHFLDTGQFLIPSFLDGVHLDLENNFILGTKVARKAKTIFAKI